MASSKRNSNGSLDQECASIIKELLQRDELTAYQETKIYQRISDLLEKTKRVRSKLLGITEVASRLRVSESFARKLCDEGKLPSTRVGKFRRVDEDDLDAYIRTRKLESQKLINEMVEDAQDMGIY